MPRTFDLDDDGVVLIVGSGAGGGTLGNELAKKGIRTLILEAGPRIEREEASRWRESLTAEKMKESRLVTPKLICQVAFIEWRDVRHEALHLRPMRDERKPADVVRET